MKFKDKICKDKTFKLIMWLLLAIVIIVGLYASQKVIYSVTADEKEPFVIYLDVQNAKEFAENGVGIYAYNSASEKDSSVPAEMKPSEMGKGIYEYTLDRKWKYVAFTGGFGSWNYELATLPVNIEWEHNTPCFVLAKPDGTNTRGVWRNLSSTLYFDASLIKNKKVFVENGVYVCAYEEIENSDGLVVVQKPVRMQQSEKGEDIYEYTFDRPYSIVRFMLGDTTDAEPASDLVNIDWSGYASPCYRMTLPDSYEDVEPEETSTEESSVEESETEESESEESSVEESDSEESSAEESSVEESESEESSAEESETEKSSVEESSNEESSVEESTAEESSEQESSSEESSAQESAVEGSSAQESTTETSETKTSSAVESTTVEEISSAEAESSAVEQTAIEHPETAEGAMSEEYSEEMQSAKSINKWVKIALAGQEARTVFRVTDNRTPAEETLANISENESSSAPESSSPKESERAIENESQNESESTSEHSSEKTPESTSEVSSESEAEGTSETSSESEPESASEDGSESEQESSSSGEGEGGEPDGELYDIDADTLMYAEVAALAIPRATTERTIYFDVCGNASIGYNNGWTADPPQIYIHYTGNPNSTNGPIEMRQSNRICPDGSERLWEFQVPVDNDLAIFAVTGTWPSGNDKSSQTVDGSLSAMGVGDDLYPCFRLKAGSGENGKKLFEYVKIGPPTMATKTMFFYDVAGKLGADVSDVYAVFSISSVADASNNVRVAINNDGEYVIPGDATIGSVDVPYDTVRFYDKNGGELGDAWNFIDYTGTKEKGFLFEEGEKDTYYYAATEKKDGTIISGWGKNPGTANVTLANKTLYFDKLHFPTKKGATIKSGKLQIGDGEPITLGKPADDSSTFCYKFPADTDPANPTVTQQTLLTFVDDAGTKYHFRWTDFGTLPDDINLVTLDNSIANVTKKYSKAVTVYFDATYSKLQYNSVEIGAYDFSIPRSTGKICYYATKSTDSRVFKQGDMELVDPYTEGNHTWSDVYKVDLDEGYDRIVFSNFEMSSATDYGAHGESTTTLNIPADIANPCFYADTGDTAVYINGSRRGGYWDEAYAIRDAEAGKNQVAVDIATGTLTRDSKKLYVNATFYDYYTDYELNANNRDGYNYSNSTSQHYRYVPFRQFNQALSDFYEKNQVDNPLYTSHFQPYGASGEGSQFKEIASTLKLYGFSESTDAYNKFYNNNNSTYDYSGYHSNISNCAVQGLVSEKLNPELMMPAKGNTSQVLEPHFNEDFLMGENSKNAVLGKVYHDVAFPFEQEDVNNDGVKYWVFDSAKTTLEMKKDRNTDSYYMDNVGNQAWSQNISPTPVNGFFPFNSKSKSKDDKTYNYGFGAKLEINFRLTADGTVENNSGQKVPITFKFAGDDDVWVFIDGQLVLDVGGGHGVSTGTINFEDNNHNPADGYQITATVDHVKSTGGVNKAETKAITLSGSKTSEYTLTMYYMERGLWDSNMKITFNFPDENTLQVEKQVDTSNVNDIFKSLFDNKSLFTFDIQTQATHYGEKEVGSITSATATPFNKDFVNGNLEPSSTSNTFTRTNVDGIGDGVAYWFANLEDRTGAYRDKRYGIINSNVPVNIENMSYLEFKFYYDYNDTPSLSNMYLQLIDTSDTPKIMGNISDYLSGKTYGITSMANNTWVTVKIRLDLLTKDASFNNQVKQIKFGYNYPRKIYLKDFVFYPSPDAVMSGFVVKQYDIPDYKTATDPQLKIPIGAVYSSTTGIGNTIGSDGTFVLQNGETITFTNQFRTGSYIYLAEEQNSPAFSALFDTSYTMYENGQKVDAGHFKTGDLTTIETGTVTSLSEISGTIVDDGRKEKVITTLDSENKNPSEGNSYKGTRPTDKQTFVYRSYSDPDSSASTTTKLKVTFTNTVKTGSLLIKKDTVYHDEVLPGTYTFKVTFTNVGGIGLENAPIVETVQLKAGEEQLISGIPIGTFYTIEEVTPTDGSYLGEVTITNSTGVIDSNHMKIHQDTGVIEADITANSTPDTATFKNTKEEKISVSVIKHWQDEVSGSALSQNIPDSVLVRLQRKKSGEDDKDYKTVPGYDVIEFTPKFDALGNIVWQYTINGLDKVVDYEHNDNTEWIYRFVEIEAVTDAGGNVTGYNVLENGNVITLTDTSSNSGDFKVTYTPTGNAIKENTRDYTITNTLLGPVNLKVVKKSMQNNTAIKGVKFLLTKPDGTKVSDGFTSEQGEIIFENLENGTYKLTEMIAANGYSLLKESMIIIIDRKDGTYKYCMESEYNPDEINSLDDLDFDSNTRTLTFEIRNAQNIVLPATGWNGLWKGIAIISAMVLMFAIMLIREERKRRRRRLRQRRRREERPPGR